MATPQHQRPVIRFSHRYPKLMVLGDSTEARLLDVLPVNLEDLSPDFLDYDTAIEGGGYYKLPKRGKYLLLLFSSTLGVFTTLRAAWPPHKERFYRENIGKRFLIKILSEQ